MKKLMVYILVTCLVFVMVYALADSTDTSVLTETQQTLSIVSEITVGVNEVKTLYPILTPADNFVHYAWSTSDPSIVRVVSAGTGATGKITGVSKGTAIVTATHPNGLSASCMVTVNDEIWPISISIEPIYELPVDGSLYLVPSLSPANAKAIFSFSTDNSSIAAVSSAGGGSSGYIFGRASGTTTITVTTNNGLRASAIVRVNPKIHPTSIANIPSECEVEIGKHKQFTPNYLPASATTTFQVSSSNEKIARTWYAGGQSSFNVYGVAGGITTVTFLTKEGLSHAITVTVYHKHCREYGHTEVVDAAKAATCTNTGLTEGKHCSVCGEVLAAQQVVPAKGHAWDDGKITREPTATEEGVKTFTCKACGNTYTEFIPALPQIRLPGDADENGAINILDALVTLQYSAGWTVPINTSNANINGDGQVNILDALLILQYGTGWNVTLK